MKYFMRIGYIIDMSIEFPTGSQTDRVHAHFESVDNVKALLHLLMSRGADKETLENKHVVGNLSTLIDRVAEANKTLFLPQISGATWVVIAASEQDVRDVYSKIEEIASFQAKIDPSKLPTQCIYAHEFANALGISDGSLEVTTWNPVGSQKPIYKFAGVHEIGYVDVDSKKTVNFDLTAKSYIFARRKQADKAVLEGIIAIEDLGKADSVRSLYQYDWHRISIASKPNYNKEEEIVKAKKYFFRDIK